MEAEKVIAQFKLDCQFRMEPESLVVYNRAIRQLLIFTQKPFDAISKRDIRIWLLQLSECGYKSSTIRNKLIGLKTFYKYCQEEELIQEDPTKTIPLPKREESVPYYLTREQLTQLRELLEGNVKERALIEVLYATGVRISELAAMKKSDIHWPERRILIPSGKGKRGRLVLFNLECAERLKTYLDSRTDILPSVFVNPLANRSIGIDWVNKRFQSYSKQLGYHVTPHTLRHTFAAHVAQKGMPLATIQKLLGHNDPNTTQIYSRLYDHARKEEYDQWM